MFLEKFRSSSIPTYENKNKERWVLKVGLLDDRYFMTQTLWTDIGTQPEPPDFMNVFMNCFERQGTPILKIEDPHDNSICFFNCSHIVYVRCIRQTNVIWGERNEQNSNIGENGSGENR